MGRVQTELERVIDKWCQAEATSYGPTNTLKGLWMRKHPTSPKYDPKGIRNLIDEIHNNEFFNQCNPPHIEIGSFTTGGAIQTVAQLSSFLDPCETVK